MALITLDNWMECQCDENNLHLHHDDTPCPVCGDIPSESPDARLYEVLDMIADQLEKQGEKKASKRVKALADQFYKESC